MRVLARAHQLSILNDSSLLPLLTLPVRTPTNVSVDYQVAPLLERSVAFVIDYVALQVVGQIFIATVGAVFIGVLGAEHFVQVFLQLSAIIGLPLVYFAFSEYLSEGRTLGKRALGLRTIRVDGAPPSFETYGLRSVMLLLDFFLAAGAIGLLAAGSSPLRQRIGDRIAQTVVIRARARSLYRLDDILNIKTVDDHDVAYPAAVDLTIEQALLIKELIVRWERNKTDELLELVDSTAARVAGRLGLEQAPQRRLEFLRQVLRDYIVLTR